MHATIFTLSYKIIFETIKHIDIPKTYAYNIKLYIIFRLPKRSIVPLATPAEFK